MADLVYEGTAAAPSAGATVVQSAALPAGNYSVWVMTHLEGSGSPAAADLDNVALFNDSTEVSALPVAQAKAALFVTPEIRVTVAAGKKLTIEAVGNATASVTYAATMIVRQTAGFGL